MKIEFLDLPIWEDDEIKSALGETPVSREKLHHWPLSYVERVDFPDRSVVIKYAKLGIENEFYSSSEADYLIKPIYMGEIWDTSVTVLPFIDGRDPTLDEVGRVLDKVHEAEFTSVWLDASSFEKFTDAMKSTADIIAKYGDEGAARELIERCGKFARFFEPEMIGYVHGDLKPDNVIVSGDKTYVIDWQRPMIAPKVIDYVTVGLTDDADAKKLAKAFETYWLVYGFDKALSSLPHVLNWAKKNIYEI